MPRRAVPVEFHKGAGRRYRSVLHRSDGVTVEFDGGAYNRVGGSPGELPHDLAHLIVEDELELRDGVWGVLARGGMFKHAQVVAGRRKPHATARGRQLVDEASDDILRAEVVVRAVCEFAEHGDRTQLRRAISGRYRTETATPEAVDRAVVRLRRAAAGWGRLAAGQWLDATWRLT